MRVPVTEISPTRRERYRTRARQKTHLEDGLLEPLDGAPRPARAVDRHALENDTERALAVVGERHRTRLAEEARRLDRACVSLRGGRRRVVVRRFERQGP